MKKTALLLAFLSIAVANLWAITPKQLENLDLNKDYNQCNLGELRLLKSMVYARHAFLFSRSELRNYFLNHYKWYADKVYDNQQLIDNGKKIPPITLTAKEKQFVSTIDSLLRTRSDKNYIKTGQNTQPNLDNLSNYFEQKGFPSQFKEKLTKYGFVIQPDSLEQLFHLYDQNYYTNTPSFITTDLYLQLLHIYFSYTLKVLEKDKLAAIATTLTQKLHEASMQYLAPSNSSKIKEMAKFNACYFAITYTLISGNNVSVPPGMMTLYHTEIDKINKAEDDNSPLFEGYLPYSLFIPRGYYTRTEEQKRYFKAMMWLQIAPYCLANDKLLTFASFNAYVLNDAKDEQQNPVKNLYKALYNPIAFLIGEGDNLSVMNICDILNQLGINNADMLTQKKIMQQIAEKLKALELKQDRIQPKIKLACEPKINFMPQRYLPDNDILQQFVDTTRNAAKAFPKGMEVFSVLGVDIADDLLFNYYKENTKWAPYASVMKQQKEKFAKFDEWNNTLYNKWLRSLLEMNKADKRYPYFMQNRGWQLKNLNTTLASWTELKHDVILYGEEPTAAEMGDGEALPPPITVGYVEPNTAFWNGAKDILSKNEQFLKQYDLFTKELIERTDSMKTILNFLSKTAEKELNHQNLSDADYKEIELISGKFDYLSLNMINPYQKYDYWFNVTGADKTIALVADVYTRNIPRCNKNGILHEATGLGNRIYVVVEIEGHLYLTRGAVFSHYEFPYPERLTDEQWLEMTRKNTMEPNGWTNEIIVSDPRQQIRFGNYSEAHGGDNN